MERLFIPQRMKKRYTPPFLVPFTYSFFTHTSTSVAWVTVVFDSVFAAVCGDNE